jgi:hypothetical protein
MNQKNEMEPAMELKPFFDSFYDKLVLRDLFGKVVPGTAVIISIIAAMLTCEEIKDMAVKLPIMPWVLLLGFSWLIGFVLQYIGELFGILRTHPYGKNKNETRDSFFLKWDQFNSITGIQDKIHAERLNIIKEE